MMIRNFSLLLFAVFISEFSKSQSFEWVNNAESSNSNGSISGVFVATDKIGNVYSTGSFQGNFDFNLSIDSTLLSSDNGSTFIVKYNSLGVLLFSKQLQGESPSSPMQIVCDSDNNIYILGSFYDSIDIDPSINEFWLSSNKPDKYYLVKLNEDAEFVWGGQFEFETNLYSDINYDAIRMSLKNNSQEIVITSVFEDSVDVDPTPYSDQYEFVNGNGLCFTRISALNGSLIDTKIIGGNGFINVLGVQMDNIDNLFLTGTFNDSIDFDPQYNEELFLEETSGAYILKLNQNIEIDTLIKWRSNSSNFISPNSLEVSNDGSVYMNAIIYGQNEILPGNSDSIFHCNSINTILFKLNNDLDFEWYRSWDFWNTGMIFAGLNSDSTGNIFMWKNFGGLIDVDPSSSQHLLNSTSNSSIFILELNPLGEFFSVRLIDGNYTRINDLCINKENIYASGFYSGLNDFDPDPENEYNLNSNYSNMFVLKLGFDPLSFLESFKDDCQFYPNPNNGIIHFQNCEKLVKDICIYNSFGVSRNFEVLNESVQIESLASGVYFMEINFDDGSSLIQKIIIS